MDMYVVTVIIHSFARDQRALISFLFVLDLFEKAIKPYFAKKNMANTKCGPNQLISKIS